jgi:hypothetical protein
MGSIVRWAAAVIVRVATYLGLFMAALCLMQFLHELVHSLAHDPIELSLFSQALDDQTPLPMAVGLALILWMGVDEWCGRREARGASFDAWPGVARTLVATAILILVCLVLFWALDGRRATGMMIWRNPLFTVSCLLAEGGLVVAGVGLLARSRPRWLRVLLPIAVVAGLAAILIYAQWLAGKLGWDPWNGMSFSLSKWWAYAGAVAVMAVGVTVVGWIEHRATGDWGRSAAMAVSAVWATTSLAVLIAVMPEHHLCLKMNPPLGPQYAGVALVVLAWAAAVGVRLWLYRNRRSVAVTSPRR